MTTTIPQQDLSITYTSTKQDAQLILSVLNGPMATRAFDGMDILFGYDTAPTFEQFDADHPHGSEGARAVSALLGINETIGTFVKQGLLDRGLVYDMFWIAGIWERCAPIATHYRAKTGVPEMYENFEALAQGQSS
ncbi:MAG: hypothetical protein JWO22_1553 [Frankiales bacterium]|nr:hypothetical protein [Frankiales bacterium]